MKFEIFSFIAIILVANVKAKSIIVDDNQELNKDDHQTVLWQPESGTREEFFECHGMPCEDYKQKLEKLTRLQEKIKDKYHVDYELGKFEDDVWLTNENMEEIEKQLDEDFQTRFKRKLAIENHTTKQYLRWELPINYKFDGTHSDDQKKKFRAAIAAWEAATCVRFHERATNEKVDKHHLVIVQKYFGCFSFVGKTYKEQLLNLKGSCFNEPGVAIHEIGHSLGLWHEHQRLDRDNWVTINRNNLNSGFARQFKMQDTVSHEVPYDFSSVMHYPGNAGARNGQIVIQAKDPLYQSSMGQRMGLSYYDAKIINLAYCKDKCSSKKLNKLCQRGGYQDPNNCDKCICPDGFSGQFCEDIDGPKNAQCGGTVHLATTGEQKVVMSPNYNSKKTYDNKVECTWLIKSPNTHRVVMKFEGEFGLYMKNRQTCYHFVEVKYGKDFENPGPRFCGYNTPTVTLKSNVSEMLVSLRTLYNTQLPSQRRGFKAVFHAEQSSTPTSTTTKPTTTTTSTTTSTTPKPTTSSTTTTTTSKPTTTSKTTTTMTTTTTSTKSTTSTTTQKPEDKDVKWSTWSDCSRECYCGFCSTQSRHTMCGINRCTGTLAKTESRVCTGAQPERSCQKEKDRRLFPGTSFYVSCPRCCYPYKFVNDKCVKV